MSVNRRQVPLENVAPTVTGMLTGRQSQILWLRSKGFERKEVAKQLGISEQTVMTHLKAAQKRLNAKNVIHAVSISIRSGWI